MSNLQHQRNATSATDLRLLAVPDLYGPIAQTAATRMDASYADFLEDVLRAERDARHIRSREMLTRMAGFTALKTLEAYDFAFATGARSCEARRRRDASRSRNSRRWPLSSGLKTSSCWGQAAPARRIWQSPLICWRLKKV